jgi:hypothetical protein
MRHPAHHIVLLYTDIHKSLHKISNLRNVHIKVPKYYIIFNVVKIKTGYCTSLSY